MDLKAVLPQLLPLAVSWAQEEAGWVADTSAPLEDTAKVLAHSAGVQHPELVRVAVVPHLPQPQHPQLRRAARQAGLLGPGMVGLTLGYTIFIVRGNKTRRVLSHELRHVHQHEQHGSIDRFLSAYLTQIAEVGYYNAALEADARAYEVDEI